MQHFSELGDIQTNYIVQPGDSLVAIALKYRLCDEVGTQKGRARCLIAASRIASENAIANMDIIRPGMQLRFMVPMNAPVPTPGPAVAENRSGPEVRDIVPSGSKAAGGGGKGRWILGGLLLYGLAYVGIKKYEAARAR